MRVPILSRLLSLRSNRQVQNISYSLVYRSIAIVCNYLIVPLLINQISAFGYGILVTIISITTWFSFIDLGLSNGLKNKISESLANNNIADARRYITTAYVTLLKVLGGVAVVFTILNYFVDWNQLIKGPATEGHGVNLLFFYGLLFFLGKVLVDLINPILLAYHKTAVSSLISLVYQAGILLVCYGFKLAGSTSLFQYGFTFFWIPLVVVVAFSFYYFSKPFKHIQPSLNFFEKDYQKQLLKLGSNFFIIQIAVLIMLTTDNLIIGRLIGYEEVSSYNIAFRYFSIPLFVFSIILTPYWPLFSELYIQKDQSKIQGIMSKLVKLWMLLVAGMMVMLLLANFVYKVWIGPDLKVPMILNIGMVLFTIITCWNNVFSTFINSTNKLRLQLYSAVFSGLLNIPLSIYLVKYTTLGSAGVILATCICLLPSALWSPIQYYKLLTGKAEGIWNK